MKRRRAEVARVISGMAGIFAVAVAVLLPFGFYAVGYGAVEAATQMEADLKSEIVSPFIGSNPDLWRFSSDRLTDMVQRGSHITGDEVLRVLDRRGEEVVRIGPALATPVMVRSAAVYDAGVPIGRLEVSRSLRPLLFKTLAMAVASTVIAAALFAVFRLAPIEVLNRTLEELGREKERAQVTLHSMAEGVISTDASGAIDYVNPAAVLMTGCAAEGLTGKGLDAALMLVDAHSGERVANPLSQAMAEKRVVKIPADALLVRADGTPIAIDGTAASIPDGQGAIAGGVLVFRKTA